MTEIAVTDIAQFLDRYRQVTAGEIHIDYQAFQSAFNRLRAGFVHITKEVAEEARKTAPSFNIFSLVGLARSETTHSAILSVLLNPNGSHGQQYLFLRSFLSVCAQIYPDFPLPSEDVAMGHWEVLTELIMLDGRLDIVIRSPDLNFLCVIENKIDASEQADQLLRYGRWMEAESENYPTQALIYLTIYGERAYTAQSTPYFRLSYHQHIAPWLRQILAEVQAPNVREVVKQYQDLVQNL